MTPKIEWLEGSREELSDLFALPTTLRRPWVRTGSRVRVGDHGDLAAPAALAVAHQQRPAPRVEVALAERQRLLHSQPPAPEHDDQRAQPEAVAIVAGPAHHRDNLLHRRRVRRIEPPLVARRAAGVVTRQRRWRAPPTGGIENWQGGHGVSSQSHSGQSPLPYQRSAYLAVRSRCRFAPTQRKSGGWLSRRPTLVQLESEVGDGRGLSLTEGQQPPWFRPARAHVGVNASLSWAGAFDRWPYRRRLSERRDELR